MSHTAPRAALGLLLLTVGAFAADCDADTCDDTEASGLNLMQKKAQAIRMSTPIVEPSSMLARDTFKVKVDNVESSSCTLSHKLQHSRMSAFISAARGPVAPLSKKERLAMLSTTEASGLSEAGNGLVIAVCAIIVLLTVVATLALFVIETKFSRIFSDIVKDGIESIAEEILGLKVTFGSMIVGVLGGSIMITALKIANPPDCKTECFLNANTVDVRLNLWSCVWKRFFGRSMDVEVDSIVFKDVGLNVEKSKTCSNVQEILKMVHDSKQQSKKVDRGSKLTLHKMTIANARATVPSCGNIAVPTVHCKDFDKATDGKANSLRPIVEEILREFCQTGEWAGELVVEAQKENYIAVAA